MFVYANGFHISVKDDHSEVLVRFVQNSPVYSSSDGGDASLVGVPTGTQKEVVSSVVMSGRLAEEFVTTVQRLMNRDDSNHDSCELTTE